MPGNTTRRTLARQWEILRALPRRGSGITVQALAQHLDSLGFETTPRTLQRDLLDLSATFAIECNDGGKPFGWRWAEGTAVDISALSTAEAMSLLWLEQAVAPLVPAAVIEHGLAQRFAQARQRLRDSPSRQAEALSRAVRFVSHGAPLAPPTVDGQVLRLLQDALANGESVSVRYRNVKLKAHARTSTAYATADAIVGMDAAARTTFPQTGPSDSAAPHPQGAEQLEPRLRSREAGIGASAAAPELLLHPLALIHRGPTPYLLALCWNFDDPRLYALHRIELAERRHEPARRAPDGFSLDEWLQNQGAQFGCGEEIQLVARLTPFLAAILAETPLSADQAITPGDGVLRATVRRSWQLDWWLLSQGAHLEVLAPPGLRTFMRQELAAALAAYDTASSGTGRSPAQQATH